jgi:hypothetical protein
MHQHIHTPGRVRTAPSPGAGILHARPFAAAVLSPVTRSGERDFGPAPGPTQPIQAKKKKFVDKKTAIFHGSLQDFNRVGSHLTEQGRRMVQQEGHNQAELGQGLNAYATANAPALRVSPRNAAGMARLTTGELARSEYEPVMRFARSDHPEDLYSPLGKFWTEKGRPDYRADGPWKKGRTPQLLTRAGQHMAGTTEKSPFVSTAQDETALLSHGDAWVSSIAFGAGDPAKRASHIGDFRVPRSSLYTPQQVRASMVEHGLGMDHARSQMETEALYHGDDLHKYLTHWRPNPYHPEDMPRFHKANADEKDNEE